MNQLLNPFPSSWYFQSTQQGNILSTLKNCPKALCFLRIKSQLLSTWHTGPLTKSPASLHVPSSTGFIPRVTVFQAHLPSQVMCLWNCSTLCLKSTPQASLLYEKFIHPSTDREGTFLLQSLLFVTGFPSGFLFHTQIALSTSILQNLSLLFLHSFLFHLMMFFLWQGLCLAQTQPKELQCITCLTKAKHLINVCRMSEGEWVSK